MQIYMLSKYLLLILLPTLAYGNMGIKISANANAALASVSYMGNDIAIISDKERAAFQLDDESLKRASKKFAGEACTDVFLKRPTPWEDVYRKFNWHEVQRILRPVSARVIRVNAKPVSVHSVEYVNDYSDGPATYSTSVNHEVKETISHTWKKAGEFSVARDLSIKVAFVAGSLGSKTTLSYTSKWGNDTTQTRAITLGATSKVKVEVRPGQGVKATLSATRGVMEIEVDYEATITGQMFCNYHNGFNGHHWWAYDIGMMQVFGNLPRKVKSTQKISVGFYSHARIVVSNLKTQVPITRVPAGVISIKDIDGGGFLN